MDHIKEAFQKVKQDMGLLRSEINSLKADFSTIRDELSKLNEQIQLTLKDKLIKKTPTHGEAFIANSIYPSTDKSLLSPLKDQNIAISTGNEGVPTDKQTNRQTNRQTKLKEENNQNSIDDVMNILNSLDDLKREIRLKFKRLTEQEFLVFSTLYQLEEEQGLSDYKTLSDKLNLTESSIRDYVGRLIKKGIPVEKTKINNKTIQLSISQNLKKIATLSTILQLRDL